MIKKITFLLCLVAAGFAACKENKNSGCDAAQVCTEEFRSLGVTFTDKGGNNVTVKNVTVVNLRTNIPLVAKNVLDPGFAPYTYFIATDSNKDEFSVNGDDVKVTATSTATNKTVSAILKISGGICNCHIGKISGPDKIVFE
ncbi:hypothetical protein IDJ77_09340 [Mucilaginibacter sp. ZT4R22]|uniref:Uncharacterized protein n=1 Tax=Mucilaginibacter pankratovii TaxID=2772110 RepID=A0ABR7WP88_9SPHI|nr:hypothetical protein [Mucilaginibacter pankratovii]MBD1364011.1 hypothetical protein [Mucilaginibacter pankratovii]